MKEILKVQNFLTKNGFDVEHFEECEKFFYEKTKLKSFLIEDIKQYL